MDILTVPMLSEARSCGNSSLQRSRRWRLRKGDACLCTWIPAEEKATEEYQIDQCEIMMNMTKAKPERGSALQEVGIDTRDRMNIELDHSGRRAVGNLTMRKRRVGSAHAAKPESASCRFILSSSLICHSLKYPVGHKRPKSPLELASKRAIELQMKARVASIVKCYCCFLDYERRNGRHVM
jgi:hypothetical protein